MKKLFLLLIIGVSSIVSWSHDAHYEQVVLKQWTTQDSTFNASFYLEKNGNVFLENEFGSLVSIPLTSLSSEDRKYVLSKKQEIAKMNREIHSLHEKKESVNSDGYLILCLVVLTIAIVLIIFFKKKNRFLLPFSILGFILVLVSFTSKTNHDLKSITDPSFLETAFSPFKSIINTRWDENYYYVESNGIANTHEMMVGIASNGWQQQVPVPQCYIGSNAWSIPLNPVIATTPVPVNAAHFSRGAIAIAINGIPIFNPYTNTGVDAFLDGQLDSYGGHSGRADDYHYHTAPLHLYVYTKNTNPIAFGLDGFAVYGDTEPDGSAMKTLDANHGHYGTNGVYHYHGSKAAPYMIGAMVGKITEDSTHQIIPQAAATPVRPSLTPLKGAVITSCKEHPAKNGYTVVYSYNGGIDSLEYNWTTSGKYTYNYYKQAGFTSASYQKFAPCRINNAQTTTIYELPNIEFNVFPLPVNDVITIQLSNSIAENNIYNTSIVDINGRIVFQKNGFQNSIAVSDLKTGMYYIQLSTKKGITSKRILID